ncbi:MAG: oxygen-insensitive NADPH nitroreductase [Phycisphaerales bacterium]|nr:oxygen-insensitive NADPH nitroreductase [Phycisphaerales bacterium]
MNDTIRTMRAHRSIRAFKATPIPDEHIHEALLAGQAAATSSAVQAFCVIRVREDDTRQKIADLAGPQQKVRDCPAFFVICADLRRHMLITERAGNDYTSSLEAFLVGSIDASLFAQNFVLAFESLGYGTCYIGGIRNDLPTVDKLLNLPRGVLPMYGLCVGLPAQDPDHRPRLAPQQVLFDDRYPDDADMLAGLDAYDETYRQYLTDRGAPPAAWTESIAKKFSYANRPGLRAYYESKGISLD